jgi:hypothetical protein
MEELMCYRGIGKNRAIAIVAACEFGKRFRNYYCPLNIETPSIKTYRSFCRLEHARSLDKYGGCGHFNFLRGKIYFCKCPIGHFAGWDLQWEPILSTFAGDSKPPQSTFYE